jgi:hypothetical protein
VTSDMTFDKGSELQAGTTSSGVFVMYRCVDRRKMNESSGLRDGDQSRWRDSTDTDDIPGMLEPVPWLSSTLMLPFGPPRVPSRSGPSDLVSPSPFGGSVQDC